MPPPTVLSLPKIKMNSADFLPEWEQISANFPHNYTSCPHQGKSEMPMGTMEQEARRRKFCGGN